MIRRSRRVLSFSVIAAMAAHAVGLWVSDPTLEVEIDSDAGAAEAVLGSSFADMVAGAAQPVSHSTVTPNRQTDAVVTPSQPGEVIRPDAPETAQTPPPLGTKATMTEETAQATEPEETAQTPAPGEAAPTTSPDAAAPVEIAAMADASVPKVAVEPTQNIDPVRASHAETAARKTQTARAVPARTEAAAAPVRPQAAQSVGTREVVEAVRTIDEGLQLSRRPQARPREIEQAVARQSPETERKTEIRGNSGSNAARDATRGSTSGAQTATAARQGRDTANRSEMQGNAAASNYPGLVMRHLARATRPRADARGAALIQFTVADGGHLASVRVARSSGSNRLDRAALTVVQRAAPFPAPPQGAQRRFSVQIEGR